MPHQSPNLRKHLLIVTYSDLSRDGRIQRQLRSLTDHFEIEILSKRGAEGCPEWITDAAIHVSLTGHRNEPSETNNRNFGAGRTLSQIAFFPFQAAVRREKFLYKSLLLILVLFRMPSKLVSRLFSTNLYGNLREAMENLSSKHVYLCNDQGPLPALIDGGIDPRKIHLDLHEYFLSQSPELDPATRLVRRVNLWVAKKYIVRVKSISAVAPEIIQKYMKEPFISVRPTLLRNVPEKKDLPPNKTEPDRFTIVHHGVFSPDRNPLAMVDMLCDLDSRFELHLFFTGEISTEFLARCSDHVGRVFIHKPVSPEDICATISKYDIGLHVLPPTSTNMQLALPNKFFEYVQASLAVVVGPSESMAKMVHSGGFGVVTKSFETRDVVAALNGLTAGSINDMKKAAYAAAKSLNWEQEGLLLTAALMELSGLEEREN